MTAIKETDFLGTIFKGLERFKKATSATSTTLEEEGKLAQSFLIDESESGRLGIIKSGQLRNISDHAWGTLLIAHKATNSETEVTTLSEALDRYFANQSAVSDMSDLYGSNVKDFLLEEAQKKKLGDITPEKVIELIDNKAIDGLLLFKSTYKQEAKKPVSNASQDGNITIRHDVELNTDKDKMSAFVLRNAKQDRLIVSDEEIKRLNDQWKEKGIGFKLEGEKLVVASILPTDSPFYIDVNATNSESNQPAIFRMMVNKVTGNAPDTDESSSKTVNKVGIGLMIGGIVAAIGSFFVGKVSEGNTKLTSALAILGTAVAAIGTCLTFREKIFDKLFIDPMFNSLVKGIKV